MHIYQVDELTIIDDGVAYLQQEYISTYDNILSSVLISLNTNRPLYRVSLQNTERLIDEVKRKNRCIPVYGRRFE